MKRTSLAALQRCVLSLVTVVLAADGAGAQLMPLQDDPFWTGAKVRVTPYVGWATNISRNEIWAVEEPGSAGQLTFFTAQAKLAGGPVAGVSAEYAVRGPFSVLAGGMYMNRDVAGFVTSAGDREGFTGSNSVFGRLGVSMQFRETESDLLLRRLNASAFVAPFVMVEMPEEVAAVTGTDLFDSSTHFGLNFGLSGELPFASDRLAAQLSFEDYFTFWNESSLARWPSFRYAGRADVDADPSHQWVVRAGLSFRFR